MPIYETFNLFYSPESISDPENPPPDTDSNTILVNFALSTAGATGQAGWYNIIGNPADGNTPMSLDIPSKPFTLFIGTGSGWFSGGDPAASDVNGVNVQGVFSDSTIIPAEVMYSCFFTFNPVSSGGSMFFYVPAGYAAEIEMVGAFKTGQFASSEARVIFNGDIEETVDWEPVNNTTQILKPSRALFPNANGNILVRIGNRGGGLNFGIINAMKIKLIPA